jgi:glycerol-3-phosphate dehydrogenase
LLGTTDTDFTGDPDAARIEEGDVAYLLERARRLIPDGPWERSDVISGFCGLRTLPDATDRSPTEVSRDWRLDEPLDGLLVSVGGKYTSARADAVIAINRVMKMLQRDPVPTETATRLFPWAPEERFSSWRRSALARALSLGLDEETAETCVLRYGTCVESIFQRLRETPQLAARVVEDAPFCRAEVIHALSDEMALNLADVLRRRVPVLLVSTMPEAALRDATAMVASELQWSPRRRERELQALNAEFKPALTPHGNV